MSPPGKYPRAHLDGHMNILLYKRYFNLIGTLAIISVFFIIPDFNAMAGDTVIDEEVSFYAVIKTQTREKKLYMEGDIFCAAADITNCLRIQDIKEGEILLKDVNSEDTFTVKLGERIPLDGVEMVFEKTIRPDIAEFEFKGPAKSIKAESKIIENERHPKR